ncbi:ankyrin repeat-containing domain protein [Aspergillus stella-maris]|uniref:ankyrin repeat-containing domain protein n=1 Tax=Aspergillus stella-maris TaxID=1810926 RepID=UPI003CCD3C08
MALFTPKQSKIPAIQSDLEKNMERTSEDFGEFIPRGSLEKIWYDKRLKEFGQHYKAFGAEDIHRIKEHFLQTLSILVCIGWNDWGRFRSIFLDHWHRRDRKIPDNGKSRLESDAFLGPAWGRKFSHTRYRFCPIDIEQGENRVLGEGWRLPFVECGIIGEGAYGSVTRQCVAARHLRRAGGDLNQEEEVIACKTFKSHNDFTKEKANLEKLRKKLGREDQNSRIMPFFTTITIANEFNLFFECADTDLERFLQGSSQGIAPRDLIEESRALAGALRFLHQDMDPQLLFCHMDLKPSNILVSFKDASLGKVGKWIISDFGISIITAAEEARPLDASKGTFRYRSTINGAGMYQAPEILTGSFGRKSDVWSLGCILVRVLAFGLDGARGLEELDERRAKEVDDQSKYHRHDFFHRGDPPVLNPHVEGWLKELHVRVDSRLPNNALEYFSELLFGALEVDTKDRITAGKLKKKLDLILSLPHTDTADAPGVDVLYPSPDPTPPTTASDRKPSVVLTSLLNMITERDPRTLAYFLGWDVDVEQVVEAPNDKTKTDRLLIHAIRHPNPQFVDGLLLHRPDLDKESLDSGGDTPLSCAIKVANTDIVTRLLESGVNPNAPSNGGLTPLMQATRTGQLDMVKLLLEKGADYLARSDTGYTCLHLVAWAPQRGAELIEEFKTRMPIDICRTWSHETPLSTLIQEYNNDKRFEWSKKFNALLNADANVNHEDANGLTPLYHALRRELILVCRILRERGATLGPKSPKDDKAWEPDQETKNLLQDINRSPTVLRRF